MYADCSIGDFDVLSLIKYYCVQLTPHTFFSVACHHVLLLFWHPHPARLSARSVLPADCMSAYLLASNCLCTRVFPYIFAIGASSVSSEVSCEIQAQMSDSHWTPLRLTDGRNKCRENVARGQSTFLFKSTFSVECTEVNWKACMFCRTQAGPGLAVKQEQEEDSRNPVQAF